MAGGLGAGASGHTRVTERILRGAPELADSTCDQLATAARGEICAVAHGEGVRTEREGEAIDHVSPQVGVDEPAVGEDDGGTAPRSN